MIRLTLERWDSNYRLAEVLLALKPMLRDFLFFVGEFEPGWQVSPESRLWVHVIAESGRGLPGTEGLMLSYVNAHYFSTSSVGMGDFDLRIAERPSDLASNNWIGVIAEYAEFEVAFREAHLVDEAERLLRISGFEFSRSVMPEICSIPPPDQKPDPYFRRDIQNILQSWDDEGYKLGVPYKPPAK